MVELDVERDHLAADTRQRFRREGASRAVAAGANDLELFRDVFALGKIIDIELPETGDELVGTVAAEVEVGFEHDLLQRAHLFRTEGERPRRPHLDAGPAILVMRGGDHGDRGCIERELREIGHGGQSQADILHPGARRHQAGDQRQLDRQRIGAEIMAGDDIRPNAQAPDQRAQTHTERLDADQIELRRLGRAGMADPPARVVLAKARRLDQRRGLEFEAVGPGFANNREGQWSKLQRAGMPIYRGRGLSRKPLSRALSDG